ncbi:Pyroglutamylated RFamide peptide receptor [Toxocara canis]|uniref:Pyroglutamylated RFamide peptide receptor n=1 Tax=Toxocara canis TaxID=6265 RepID=A0A0B2VAS3_TOXCA|nr:Pyroglutamylated RFamide peptide receptor [Toxocara canis]
MSITINASASMLVNSATESNPLREGSINCTGAKALTDFIITRLVFGIAYVLIFTLAVSGNSLVVYVVINNKTMQTVTNIFITNLAISDLLALTDFIITRLVFGIAYVLIFTLAVSGNSLVVYVVINNKTMQTVTNIFITNLAISDLLVNFTFPHLIHQVGFVTTDTIEMQLMATYKFAPHTTPHISPAFE